MFNLNIKSGNKKIIYKPLSVSLKYVVNEKNLDESVENIIKVFGLKLSELQRKYFLSKEGKEIRISKFDGKPDEVILSKLKVDEKFSVDYFRNHLAGIIPAFENSGIKNLHIFIPKHEIFKDYFESESYFYQTFIEGVYFGNYKFDQYKSDKKDKKDLNILIHADDEKKLKLAIDNAGAVMDGVYFARELQNEPANELTPKALADRIAKTFSGTGIKVKIFDEKEIKKRKMGGLLAVGGGSSNTPRFIVAEYKGSSKKGKKIALVGKGITFDSGGISIKPAQNMGEMKADMSGAAVVAGTLLAAAKAKLPVDILGVIASAENMLSGKAFRPGDIIKTASGKTVEVDNTDAEGRIILADALDYASKEKPDAIIDLATLTGACLVALGEFTAGSFTKNENLSDELYKTGLKTYDRVWPMPMWDDYNDLNKSEVADVKNLGGKWAGAISAAKFLENFVDPEIPWVHLDIAGPAMASSFNNYTKKWMTGFGVRLLFDFLKRK